MPELPEVELLKRGLQRYVKQQTVSKVEIRTPRIFSGNKKLVVGGVVIKIRRFGKLLVVDLNNSYSLAIHVKMTGRLIYRGKKEPEELNADSEFDHLPGKHTHVIFGFKGGDKLYYNDVRKFGFLKVVKTDEVEQIPFVRNLGPEPLKNLSQTEFGKLLAKYSQPIKTLLMDQNRIAGVGNIYANEALFCAKITPKRKANTIHKRQAIMLFRCLNKVLKDGIKYGGSSTDSFRDVLGRKGSYQNRYFVYGREGKKCLHKSCSGKIVKVQLAGRGTYFCMQCQK